MADGEADVMVSAVQKQGWTSWLGHHLSDFESIERMRKERKRIPSIFEPTLPIIEKPR